MEKESGVCSHDNSIFLLPRLPSERLVPVYKLKHCAKFEMSSVEKRPRRIGVVGFGNLGQYLVDAILENDNLELGFVWNRTLETITSRNIDEKYILKDLPGFSNIHVDLIVEVAHPSITEQYGELFLDHADYMIGSPTTLANEEIQKKINQKAHSNTKGHGLYVPSGAFWGGEDIKKMADRGTLKGLTVTMKKAPSAFKLCGYLKEKNEQVTKDPVVLYSGAVRGLCPLAPNNVNTMAAASIAAHNIGFDGVKGVLVADPSLNCHIVEVEVFGLGEGNNQFHVKTVRTNPSKTGVVTGSATYSSFLSSMLVACGKGVGVHLC